MGNYVTYDHSSIKDINGVWHKNPESKKRLKISFELSDIILDLDGIVSDLKAIQTELLASKTKK